MMGKVQPDRTWPMNLFYIISFFDHWQKFRDTSLHLSKINNATIYTFFPPLQPCISVETRLTEGEEKPLKILAARNVSFVESKTTCWCGSVCIFHWEKKICLCLVCACTAGWDSWVNNKYLKHSSVPHHRYPSPQDKGLNETICGCSVIGTLWVLFGFVISKSINGGGPIRNSKLQHGRKGR